MSKNKPDAVIIEEVHPDSVFGDKFFNGYEQGADTLSTKERLFCEHYVLYRDLEGSAIHAGYSRKSAKIQAYRIMNRPRVRNYIRYIQSKHSLQFDNSRDAILQMLTELAYEFQYVDPNLCLKAIDRIILIQGYNERNTDLLPTDRKPQMLLDSSVVDQKDLDEMGRGKE